MKFKDLPQDMQVQALKVDKAKRLAYQFGLEGKSFRKFNEATHVGRDFDLGGRNGVFAEIVIAWMCGAFAKIDPDFSMETSVILDHEQKADFLISRQDGDGGVHSVKVQVKFNNNEWVYLPHDVILVRLGPSSHYLGGKHLPVMTGMEVFTTLLISSGLYDAEEVVDDPCIGADIKKMFNETWDSFL